MAIEGIICGLGNPGAKYAATRHNMGFWVVEALREYLSAHPKGSVEPLSGGRFQCELWRCKFPGNSNHWLLAMPQTFMNLSGTSVQPLLAWHKLNPRDLLVLHDDLDLPSSSIKLKFSGGSAGHNGLNSLSQTLGTQDYHRLRLGIGRSPYAQQDTVSWVLGHFSAEEKEAWAQNLPLAVKALCLFVYQGASKAANVINSKDNKLADIKL